MFRTAYRFLKYDKAKSIGTVVGITLSVFLVGQQSGVFLFLTNSIINVVNSNKQYIWLVDESTTDANKTVPLDVRIGRQVTSIAGVRRVHEVVISAGSVKRLNGKTAGLSLIGVQAPTYVGLWNLEPGVSPARLLTDGALFMDVFSENLGDVKTGETFEFNGKRVYKAGQTRGTQGLGIDYAFTTIERARSLTGFSPNKVSFFLVEAQPGADPAAVVKRINGSIAGVRAWTGDAFADSTFTQAVVSGGFAATFGFLIIFAIIAGFVIIGLTLYSAANERIQDYGTLKAIGAANGYITRLILLQAMLMAIIGYAIGRIFVEGFRLLLMSIGSNFSFSAWLEVGFISITLFIALGGSLFAIRRITSLEPASVFRR
ncbi:ABC transporter permease [Spirosoma sp. 209]|uniref:ABC transporter permease n=1 Tax=Spirosoma sp. 209 TaxID=1955701 RepID=UPI00098D591C|nr:ABC transporter permease [Spirosoma sp. 209]